MNYVPLVQWLKMRTIIFVMDGPRLPGRWAERLFNWAMSDHKPERIGEDEGNI